MLQTPPVTQPAASNESISAARMIAHHPMRMKIAQLTGERVVDAETCRYTLAVMTTAGLYEASGDWLYDIGLPGKSGMIGLDLFLSKPEA
jgi:glutaminase